MRLHVAFSPMLHSAVQARVQVPNAHGGWATLGVLHGKRTEIVQFFQQLERGAHHPGEVTSSGQLAHPTAASARPPTTTHRA